MTPDAFRTLALSMPGADEVPHFARTSFRVGTKIFATMTPDGREAMVPVKPVERCLGMIAEDPETYFEYAGWTRRLGSLGIRLAKADTKTLRGLVIEAWERLSPRKARPRA